MWLGVEKTTLENHKMGPFSDFQGLISQRPATFTAQLH